MTPLPIPPSHPQAPAIPQPPTNNMPKPTIKALSSTSTKTVLDKIVFAIRNQPQTLTGVSRSAIGKYLRAELSYDNPAALKTNLKKGVSTGKLAQTGQSFRVKGDAIPERAPEVTVDMKDVKMGMGDEEAKSGDTVVMKYEGKLENGIVFDSSSSFPFTLGAGDVIKGWDIGIAGMKVGGIRKLSVPSKLGYGKRGSAPAIPPNADLFFTVTLKKIV